LTPHVRTGKIGGLEGETAEGPLAVDFKVLFRTIFAVIAAGDGAN
jgi:hypothetical protein